MVRALALVSLLLLALPAAAQQQVIQPEVPFLAAEATGEVRVAPDRAVVRFGVQHQADEAQQAQGQVSQAMNRVVDALRKMGIPDKRIGTERLELQPIYDHGDRSRGPLEGPRLVGFRASNVVRVELPIEAKGAGVGGVIDAAISNGANTVEGIQFQIADEQPHYLRAMRLASEQAREKARALAAALGVRTGELLEAREGGVDVDPPRPMMMDRAMVKAESTPISPGEMSVRATVVVRYAIEQ